VEEPKANGVRIGFVQCDDWAPPRALQPQFDCRGPAPSGLRKLKRWVRGRAATWHPPEGVGFAGAPAELDGIAGAVADRPGVRSTGSAALAYAFVRAYAEDFDEVFRLECAGRTPVALAGELGAQIGLGLESDLPGNLKKLREFCSARRFLVLLEDPKATMSGCSPSRKLFHADGCRIGADGAPKRDPFAPSRPNSRTPGGDWLELCRLARIGRRIARDQNRIAELYELLRDWHALADAQGDRNILDESAREMVWVLEGWGRFAEASQLKRRRVTEFGEQMACLSTRQGKHDEVDGASPPEQ